MIGRNTQPDNMWLPLNILSLDRQQIFATFAPPQNGWTHQHLQSLVIPSEILQSGADAVLGESLWVGSTEI
jgi:hypothetical protein